MPEYMQYSEEWKAEMKKLPKEIIINIASQIGIEKQNEINVIKQQKAELLEVLIEIVRISDRNNIAWNRAKEVIKKATE